MIIDCHYHIDERMIPINTLLQHMEREGVDKIALMAEVCDPVPDPSPTLVKIVQFFYTHKRSRFIGKMVTANFTKEGNIKLPGHEVNILR